MFKYKLEIVPLSTQGADSLTADKKQMLTGMLALLAQAFKSMPEVKTTSVAPDNSIVIESTEDLDLRFKSLGNNIRVSKYHETNTK
jgi:hypothetical protein